LRISRKKPGYNIKQPAKYRINQYINVPEVRLIDESGENIGIIETRKALEMAQDSGMDLVEVFPKAKPPVAKIIDFSKMKYREEKERRKEKAKQKKVEIKGIRLSLRISDHDQEVRIKQAEKFLKHDNKVKIELILKGREKRHQDLAKEIIKKFIDSLDQLIPTVVEQPIDLQGGKISILVAKK